MDRAGTTTTHLTVVIVAADHEVLGMEEEEILGDVAPRL